MIKALEGAGSLEQLSEYLSTAVDLVWVSGHTQAHDQEMAPQTDIHSCSNLQHLAAMM